MTECIECKIIESARKEGDVFYQPGMYECNKDLFEVCESRFLDPIIAYVTTEEDAEFITLAYNEFENVVKENENIKSEIKRILERYQLERVDYIPVEVLYEIRKALKSLIKEVSDDVT